MYPNKPPFGAALPDTQTLQSTTVHSQGAPLSDPSTDDLHDLFDVTQPSQDLFDVTQPSQEPVVHHPQYSSSILKHNP